MIGLSLDPDKCTGCELCSLACSTRFDPRGFNRHLAAIRVHVIGIMDADVPVTCMQCEEAPCAAACPEEAFYWNAATRALLINQEKCSNCGVCVPACPYGVLYAHPNGEAPIKCDLCDGNPFCVGYCVPGAISLSAEPRWRKERRDAYFQVLGMKGGVGR